MAEKKMVTINWETGQKAAAQKATCTWCKGKGEKTRSGVTVKCSYCGGLGYVWNYQV